ncbi:MAG: DUF4164 domain-containing protein [Nitratireductor sp.]
MSNDITGALGKLNSAIEMLDKVVDARILREEALLDAEAEVQRMGADRTRLGESLDEAQSRSQNLENANREVSKRLVDAMESIRAVLDK